MNPMENAVYRDVRGEAVLVGIMAEGASGPEFCYDATYLAAPDAAPLSFSLPLRGDPYALAEFRPYFEGLLPEGPPLRRLAVNLGIDEADWLDMLFRCGLDCVGDVVVDRDAFSCKREYRALSPDDLASLARRPAGQTEALEASRLSLAGTQDKCGLYHDPRKSEDEGWHLPLGGAPSNFIVKFASDEHPHLVVVEKVCLDAARACGIAVPESFLLDVGRPALCVKRFDRAMPDAHVAQSGSGVDGLPVPLRLHQEDFSQAFGLLPGSKYRELHPSTAVCIAAFLRRYSLRPAADLEQLARIVVFDYLVGNCDNHLKNLSIMHESRGLRVRLAPAYDLVGTTLFARYSRRMGMRIGKAALIDDVRAEDFAHLASELGVTRRFMEGVAAGMADGIVGGLREAGDVLGSRGFSVAPYLADDLAQDCASRLSVLASFAR